MLERLLNPATADMVSGLVILVCCFGLFLETPLWGASVLLLLILLAMKPHRFRRAYYAVYIGLAILCLLRGFGAYTIMAGARATPPRYANPSQYLRIYPLVGFFGLPDENLAVLIIDSRTALIGAGRDGDVDPFSGKPFPVRSGTRYSVGPDQKDDGMSLVYDPTNGAFSTGDLPLPGGGQGS